MTDYQVALSIGNTLKCCPHAVATEAIKILSSFITSTFGGPLLLRSDHARGQRRCVYQGDTRVKFTNLCILTLALSLAGRCQAAQPMSSPDLRRSSLPAKCSEIKVIDQDATNMAVASPDGKNTVCVKEDRGTRDEFTYTSIYWSHHQSSILVRRLKDIGSSVRVFWSPDSTAFALEWTFGGASSGWSVDVFQLKSRRFLSIDRAATRDFHRRLLRVCGSDETDDNVFFRKWVNATAIILAVEAHPGGLDCRSPAPTEFYEVAVPSGRIIRYFQGNEHDSLLKQFQQEP
jgi:hypothetical protein